MSNHIVLLGDSIFDNSPYTNGEPDVVSHLNQQLPPTWRATLLAVDGAITIDVLAQCRRVPDDASHIVLSVGGNDALQRSELLSSPVASTADALMLFNDAAVVFEANYDETVQAVRALGLPTTLCTIYNGDFPEGEAEVVRVALMLFNDAILRIAFDNQLDVIDLRSVCRHRLDYANPIEPSGEGGRKIAAAITRALGLVDNSQGYSRTFAANRR